MVRLSLGAAGEAESGGARAGVGAGQEAGVGADAGGEVVDSALDDGAVEEDYDDPRRSKSGRLDVKRGQHTVGVVGDEVGVVGVAVSVSDGAVVGADLNVGVGVCWHRHWPNCQVV